MKLIPIEKAAKSPRPNTDVYIINLAANNLPTEERKDVEAILKRGMEIEIAGYKTILRGVEYFAVSSLPGGQVAIMVDKK